MSSTPCSLVFFTCKDQILKAIYMQITNHFSGERKNYLLNFCHHQRKLSCTQALSFKESVHEPCTHCVRCEEYLQRYPFDKERDLLIKLIAVLREKHVSKGQSGGIRACRQAVAETDLQCHNQQEKFHCCPPSPRAAPRPAPPPRWDSGARGLQLWRGSTLRPHPPPGRS